MKMKINKTTITIISIATIAIVSIASYKLLSSEPSQNSKDSKQIVANYKGGVVTSEQAQIELNKLIVKNPNLKGLTF